MSKNPKTYWIIQHREGHVYPHTLRVLRRDAIEAFLSDSYSGRKIWADCVPAHKAIKVRIVKAGHD